MPKAANIQYFSTPGQPFEVIICQNSTISYPLHNHISVYTVGLVLQGSLLLGVGEQTSLCQAGSAFVLPPYQPHFIKAQAAYSLLTVCIDKQSLEQQPAPTRQRLRQLLDNLKLTKAQKNRLLARLKPPQSDQAQPKGNLALRQAQKQLEKHPESSLSVAELAQAAYLSQYHFIRCFKRAVGLTPHQFQLQNRVRRGQQLLQEKNSIIKVALLTGFYDQSHFDKNFVKMLGLSPSRYRQACRPLSEIATANLKQA